MSSSEDESTMSKKPAPSKKIVIQVAPRDAKKDPIVASFPGGLPHIKGEDDKSQMFVWRKVEATGTKGRMVMGKDSTCVYQAESDPDAKPNLTKHCVGLYNKKTGKLTLHQTAQEGTVFSLRQIVRNYKEELPSLTRTERRKALFDAFGTSKKQKVIRSQAANVVNVNSVVGSGKIMRKAFLANQSEEDRLAMEQQQANGTTVRIAGLFCLHGMAK